MNEDGFNSNPIIFSADNQLTYCQSMRGEDRFGCFDNRTERGVLVFQERIYFIEGNAWHFCLCRNERD